MRWLATVAEVEVMELYDPSAVVPVVVRFVVLLTEVPFTVQTSVPPLPTLHALQSTAIVYTVEATTATPVVAQL